MAKSLLPVIYDIFVDDREFTNKETGELVKYRRLAIDVSLDGERQILDFVPSDALGKAGFTLLNVADKKQKV